MMQGSLSLSSVVLEPLQLLSFRSHIESTVEQSWWSATAFLVGVLGGVFVAITMGVLVFAAKRCNKATRNTAHSIQPYERINSVSADGMSD